MIEFNFQTLIFYLLGCLGALLPKFLERYYNRKRTKKKIKRSDIFWESGYILFGGVVSVILTPANELHAFLFGATWESLILNYIKKFGGKHE